MQHEAIPSELPRVPFDLSDFAKRTVLAGIDNAVDDPAEQKERVMLARQCGFLSDDETAAMIAKLGLADK